LQRLRSSKSSKASKISKDSKHIEHIVLKYKIFSFFLVHVSVIFFPKFVFAKAFITYSWTPILVWIFLIWVFIVSVFYNRVITSFLKRHCQYGSNVYWESYIEFYGIFNYLRELYLPYLTSYKKFVSKCIIMFWCGSNFVCYVK